MADRARSRAGPAAGSREDTWRADDMADRVHPRGVVVLDYEGSPANRHEKGEDPDRHPQEHRRRELALGAGIPDGTVRKQHPVSGGDRDSRDLGGDRRGSAGLRRPRAIRHSALER